MENELTLDKVHGFIDSVSEERDRLQHVSSKVTEPAQWPALCDAVAEVDHYYGIGPSSPVRVPRKLVNSFTRTFDPVEAADALILASKVVSFLRSIEGQMAPEREVGVPALQIESLDQKKAEVNDKFPASLWVPVPRRDEVKRAINELSLLLDSILSLAGGSNLPDEHRALSAIERAQLIAILETALRILKAPMVEKSLMRKARDGLKEAAKKTARKQTEKAFGQLAEEGSKLLGELLSMIPW